MQPFEIHHAFSVYHGIGACLQNYLKKKNVHNVSVHMWIYL